MSFVELVVRSQRRAPFRLRFGGQQDRLTVFSLDRNLVIAPDHPLETMRYDRSEGLKFMVRR